MMKLPAAQRPRLMLEDYILFFTTHSGKGLTIDLLNQILFTQGFVKYHRSNKMVIVDALNSLDLLRPRRSTISINATVSPPRVSAAELSTEDVRRDIENLGWRVCPVGSVLSIRSEEAPLPLTTIPPGSTAIQRVPLGSVAVQRVPQSSVLGAFPPLPPPAAPGVAGKRKRGPQSKGKVAIKQRERRMMELLALPSLEDMSAAV